MDVQYLTNDKGERVSVLIPYDEWKKLNNERIKLRRKLQEAELTERYRNTIADAKLFQEGKLATYPLQDLLNEL